MSGCVIHFSRPAVVSACGIGPDALWRCVSSADNSAVRPVRTKYGDKEFYAATLSCPLPAPASSRYPDTRLFRMVAASLEQLGEPLGSAIKRYGADRVGVCAGGCDNGSELSIEAHSQYLGSGEFPSGYTLEMQGAGYVAAFIKDSLGLGGLATAIATACSSSSTAIVRAAEMLRAGICDAVVAGGADIVSDLELLGFGSMECVSPVPSNPFSVNRSGISLGEAAAFFVLSKDSLVSEEPHVILAGYGESSDAFHITSPDTDGAGAAAAMRRALDSAGLGAGQLDFIGLHGTGTVSGDAAEARAVSAVFGPDVPCASCKSVTGHTLGAAGVLTAAVCYEALARNALPLQAWDGMQDPELPPVGIVSAGNVTARGGQVRCCMSNSFGFGGVNVSLIMCKDRL